MKNIFIFVFALSVSAIGAPCLADPWDLNDVTILYPLPDPQDATSEDLLGFTDLQTNATFIDKDPLFYGSVFAPPNSLPEIKMTGNDVLNAFRVVGVRFDPCFRDTFADPCRPQIRFTWATSRTKPI